ncbi:MAG: hypothetical protein H6740_16325 [Alphaproteobacteria bacterium]|nr:hypothetical protein [Alphaproteobacteria bacterium]
MLLGLLAAGLAWATGVPPTPTIVARGADCAQVDTVEGELRITFDSISGVCVPRPPEDGPSCSWYVDEHLDASGLSVWLEGCDPPQAGQFARVEGALCEARPVWRWTGEVTPGQRHLIGFDGGGPVGWFQGAGEAVGPLECPPDSPITPLPPTEVTRSGPYHWRPMHLAESGFSVQPEGELVRLVWRPEGIAPWAQGLTEEGFRSAPISREAAEAALAGAERNPLGLGVNHRAVEARQHFEGYDKRGVVYCEGVVEQDSVLQMTGSEVVLQGRTITRFTAEAGQCQVGGAD